MNTIGILELSLSGGLLILAVILLRALALDRLPKGTFVALWLVAAIRLLVPVSIPSPLSVYSLVRRAPEMPAAMAPAAGPAVAVLPVLTGTETEAVPGAPAVPLWETVWLAGALVCGGFFLLSYLRCRREYRTALPVEEELWERCRDRLGRRIALRQSDRVAAPLTYGLLHPVILLPRDFDPSDGERLDYVLEHELVHIRRLDGLTKLVLAAAACVHWFNPLAWAMLVLANRDIELRCDEAVVARFGRDKRSAYAMTLIAMEAQKSGLGPFASAFSKNAIEERIRAIMKMKKRSLAAIMAAVVLVCCVSVAFATSAAERKPMPRVADGSFTGEELEELSALWLDGWEDMTVAAYQEALWKQKDTPEHYALIERYGKNHVSVGYFNDPQATEEANAFHAYFQKVFEPLTGDGWQERFFAGIVTASGEDRRLVSLEYSYTLGILDRNQLTAGAYWQAHRDIEAGVQAMAEDYAAQGLAPEEGLRLHEAAFSRLSRELTTSALSVTVEGGMLVQSFGKSSDGVHPFESEDEELHRQSSQQTAREWDRLLAPYAPFGLSYAFDDPDLDGNGLTMTYQGREVRGIMDPQVGWITEHTGLSAYGEEAVELYAVYADGALTGLRLATPEEQAALDQSRRQSPLGIGGLPDQEAREFPRAAREDYDSLLALRTEGYEDLSLEVFNQRLLDWANEHSGAWDRISCDVIWNDYGVRLTEEERSFAALTCLLSGTENGQMVRALHTGQPEEDPGFAANLPEILREENGGALVWCDLYYDVSYHIPDRAGATVGERDRCAAGMQMDIAEFWESTDLDALLTMTEEDVAALFNQWGAENSTDNVRFNPVTADNLHFEHMDERGRQ